MKARLKSYPARVRAYVRGPVTEWTTRSYMTRGQILRLFLIVVISNIVVAYAFTYQRATRSAANQTSIGTLCDSVAANTTALRDGVISSKHDKIDRDTLSHRERVKTNDFLAQFKRIDCEDLPIIKLGPIGGSSETSPDRP